MRRFYQYNYEVTAQFDLNILSFYRVKGQDWPQFPGLLAINPPKRTARGREDDHLLVYLTLSGNIPLTSAEYARLTSEVSGHFYQTAGSLTSAIRTAVQSINQALLERNLRTTGQGQYLIGRLILGVLRGAQVFIAQSGPTHVFHITGGETRQIHDAQISGRGLGFSQTTPLYFSQTDLQAGDTLVCCSHLPANWDTAILENNPSPEALRRKLLTIGGEDLNALLVTAHPGQGNFSITKGTRGGLEDPAPAASSLAADLPGGQPASGPAATPEPSPARPVSQVESGQPASRFARLLAGEQREPSPAGEPPAGEDTPAAQAEPPAARRAPVSNPARRASASVAAAAPAPRTAASRGRFASTRAAGELPEISRPGSRSGGEVYRGLARLIRGARQATRNASQGIKAFLPRLLPNLQEGEGEMTGPGLGFLAIAIPLIIVTIASIVYVRYGRSTQYQENYGLALEQAVQARGQSDPLEIRRTWDSTLYYLDRAESYQVTQESSSLRQEAQTALDNLDGILRLGFRPAIVGGLGRSVQVSRMAATNTDLYLLDAARGSVIRASLGSQGYEVDDNFRCGPGQYGNTLVGTLIDVEALQVSNIYNARLVAMDGSGNLLYCGFNMQPVAVTLAAPVLGWRGISGFALDTDEKNLYVLDPAGNAVWVYTGNYGEFTGQPTIFFGEQVPQNMGSTIDLAANSADLYLLFSDGHIAACPLSRYDVVPLRCSDPITFVDTRPGQVSGPKLNDGVFTQVSFASAPDPSLYMLEPLTRAVFRFSPRSDSVELRGQFRATPDQNNTDFSGSATAMAISPNRYLFLSMANQVFYATDVP
jgi:hypothetical protein